MYKPEQKFQQQKLLLCKLISQWHNVNTTGTHVSTTDHFVKPKLSQNDQLFKQLIFWSFWEAKAQTLDSQNDQLLKHLILPAQNNESGPTTYK